MASGELEIVGQTGPRFEAPADQVVWVLSDDEDGVRPARDLPPRKRPRVATSAAGGNSAARTVTRAAAGPSAAARQAEPVVVEEIGYTNRPPSSARPGQSEPMQSVPELTTHTVPDEANGATATSQEDARPSEVETVHVVRRRRPQPVEAARNNGDVAHDAAVLEEFFPPITIGWPGREMHFMPEHSGDHTQARRYSFDTPHPEEAEEVGRAPRDSPERQARVATDFWQLGATYRPFRWGRGQTRTTRGRRTPPASRESHPEVSRRLRSLQQSQNDNPQWMAAGPAQLETRIIRRQHGPTRHNLELHVHEPTAFVEDPISSYFARFDEQPAGDDYERNLRLDERVPSRRGATRDAIRGVKSAKIKAEDVGETCCICLAQFAKNERGKRLPCSHLFHPRCIDRWLKVNAECPLCKQRMDMPQNGKRR